MRMFKHQQALFESTKDREHYALLWEMRVGKNLPIIATALHNYTTGRINTVLIIAPSGVHINWSRVVIPMPWPEDLAGTLPFTQAQLPQTILEWRNTPAFLKKASSALLNTSGLTWFCMNVEALATKAGYDMVQALATTGRTMLVVDESDTLKSPRAERTKVMLKLAPKFPVRRILTGTSAPQGPFDLWSQFGILDPGILQQRLFTAFKQRYGIFRKVKLPPINLPNGKTKFRPPFEQLVAYRDVEHITKLIAPHSSRLTQADVYQNLPPLVHEVRYFEMTDAQAQAYKTLKTELMLELQTTTITATNALTAMLRLQQISRGFLTQGEDLHLIPGANPAVQATIGAIQQIEGKVIVWANFTEDINQLIPAMDDEGIVSVRYDGQVSKDDRYINLQAFLTNPKVKVLVGTPATGGVGLDVSVASAMIFHSHSYKLRERLQAIARMQGPNQKSPSLLLIDILGADTGDQKCLTKLASKQDMMDGLVGDSDRASYTSPTDLLTQLLGA